MSHIFISYVRDDSEQVDRLTASLEAAGLETWVDREDMRAGQNWQLAVPEVVASARFFIACFSRNVEQRERSAMFAELRDAAQELRNRLPLSPWFMAVLFEPVEVPEFAVSATENLAVYQRVELFPDWDAGVERLLKELAPEAAARLREPRVLSQLGPSDPSTAPQVEIRPPPRSSWAVARTRRVTRGVQNGSRVQALAFDTDRQQLITIGGSLIRSWRLPALQPLEQRDNGCPVCATAFGPAGRIIATAGEDRFVRLWDTAGGDRPLHTLSHADAGGSDTWFPRMALSADDAFLATGYFDSELRVWDTATGERVEPVLPMKSVNALAFGPYGRLLAVGDGNSSVRLFDVVSGQDFEPMEHPSTDGRNGIKQLVFSPDGAMLVSVSRSGSLCTWDVETGEKQPQLCQEENTSQVAFGRSPAVLAGVDEDGSIHVWDTTTGSAVFEAGGPSRVSELALSPDGSILATAAGPARLYDIRSKEEHAVDAEFLVRRLAFSVDGGMLATAGFTRAKATAQIWDPDEDAVRVWAGTLA